MLFMTSTFKKAIDAVGGVNALAGLLQLRQNVVSNWLLRERVPAERCPDIERVTLGAVTCEELRPDVDWAYLRGTAKTIASVSSSAPSA
jgi:DNA-binding transcriptional regulator YdaS (Cro superfamily)